jgi:hypothetical protein
MELFLFNAFFVGFASFIFFLAWNLGLGASVKDVKAEWTKNKDMKLYEKMLVSNGKKKIFMNYVEYYGSVAEAKEEFAMFNAVTCPDVVLTCLERSNEMVKGMPTHE